MLECECFPEWTKKRWGWVVCAASFTIHVGIYSLAYCFSLLFVDIQHELNSTAVETGFVGSVIWGVQVFSSPVGSFLESLLTYRAVLILVITVSSASIFAASFADSAKQLLVTIGVCYGLSLGTAWYVMLSVMVSYFPTKNSVRAVSLATTGSAAAMLCISEPVNISIEAFGWRKTLQFIAVFVLVVSLPPAAFMTSPPKVNDGVRIAQPLSEEEYLQATGEKKQNEEVEIEKDAEKLKNVVEDKHLDDGKEDISESTTSSASDVAKIRDVSSRLQRWKKVATLDTFLYAVFALTCAMSWSVFFVNIVSFYDSVGIDSQRSTTLVTITAIFEVVSKILLATVGEKVPFRKTYLLLAKSVMLVFLSLSMVFASSFPQFIALSIVTGLLRACYNVLLWPCSLESLDRSCSDEIIIIVSVTRGIGFLTGTIPAGAIYDHFGSYRMAFLLVSAISCISTICLSAVLIRWRLTKSRYTRNQEQCQDAIVTLTGIKPLNGEESMKLKNSEIEV